MATNITKVITLNDNIEVPLTPVLSFTGLVDSVEESKQIQSVILYMQFTRSFLSN